MTLSGPEITDTASEDPPVEPPPSTRSRWRAASVAQLLALLVPTLMGALLVGLHVHSFTSISIFDEFPHYAYAWDVSHGKLPSKGDAISQGALSDLACRAWQSGFVPPCTNPAADPATVPNALDVQYYPEAGQIYTTDHPPLYYAISGVGGRVIASVTGLNQFVATRLMGIFWIALGNLFLWLTMRRMRVPTLAMFGVLAVLVSVPATIYTASTVNPDVASVPMAAVLTWAIVRWWQGDLKPYWFALIGAAVVATKITNGMVVFAGLLLILGLSIAGYRAGRARMVRDWLVASLSLGIGGVVVLLGWGFRYNHTARPYSLANIAPGVPTLPGRHLTAFDPRWLFTPDLTMVVRADRNPGILPPQFEHVAVVGLLTTIIAVVILLATFVVLRRPYTIPDTAMAIVSLVAPLAAASVWSLYNFYVMHVFVVLIPRYLYMALALQTVIFGMALRTRWSQYAVSALGVVTFLCYVRMLRSG